MVRQGKSTRAYSEKGSSSAGGAGGEGSGRLASRSMNLKGGQLASAVGRCVTVLYEEGDKKPTPYPGCVVYAEPAR